MADIQEIMDFGLSDSLKWLLDQNQFIDVVLVSAIDLVTIPAHRLILTACSGFFKEKFASMDQSQSWNLIVVIDELPGRTLKTIINCFYTGYLNINCDNVDNMLAAAKTLRLPNITKACVAYIERNLSTENCIELHALAARHDLQLLREKLKHYACNNFNKIYKTDSFLRIDRDTLGELLSNDNLVVNSEEDVMNALLRWLQHDESRGEHIANFINHIRVEHLSPTYLANRMDIVDRFPQLQGVVKQIFLHQFAPMKNLPHALRQPRRGLPVEQTFVVICSLGRTQKPIYEYSSRDDEWTQLMQVDIEQDGFAICTVSDNELIIAGGEIDHELTNKVLSINLRTKSVKTLSAMNTSRKCTRLSVLNNCIYAIGGYNVGGELKTVERLVQNNGIWSTWSFVADMSEERYDHAVATFEGLLYVVGGHNSCSLKSVECYDPQKNEWRACAPMNEPRCQHEVVALNNYLYAVGGRGSDTMERYDPRINKWTQVCYPRFKHEFFACVAINDRLIVAGGNGENSVEEYNPELNVWTTKSPLPVDGRYVGALANNI